MKIRYVTFLDGCLWPLAAILEGFAGRQKILR